MSAPIRSVLVVASRFPFGSQEAYLSAELEQLARHFERVAVVPVHSASGPARHPVPAGVELLSWPLISPRLAWSAARAFARRPLPSARILARLAVSRDPGRLKNAVVLIKALALGRWAKQQGYDHIHAYWMSTPSTVAMLAAAAGETSWSATAHRWDIYERNAFDVKESTVSFVRTISERGQRDMQARMPSLNGRLIALRLGIAVPSAPLPVAAERGAEFPIVCPAALVPVKGHEVLLAALERLRQWKVPVTCTLAGDGPLRERLEATVERLHLRNVVRFEGFVAQERLHAAYRAGRFAAVVLSSRCAGEKMMEGLPSALLEAMAFGVPVVAANSGSIGELIDERCGLLVAPDDPDGLAAALYDVYCNPGAARERAERAYALVSDRYDVRSRVYELATAIVQRG